jgi:hypothetical protein
VGQLFGPIDRDRASIESLSAVLHDVHLLVNAEDLGGPKLNADLRGKDISPYVDSVGRTGIFLIY